MHSYSETLPSRALPPESDTNAVVESLPSRAIVAEPTVARGAGRAVLAVYATARSIVLTLAAIVGVTCALAFAGSQLFGVKPLVVVSGSMEPTLPVGSVVFSRATPASEISAGQIVTVERPRNLGLVTHRLVESTATGTGSYSFVLRGDANTANDAEPYDVTSAGVYVWHVPWLGFVAATLQTQGGMLVGSAFALGLVALFLVDPQRLRKPQVSDDTRGSGHASEVSIG